MSVRFLSAASEFFRFAVGFFFNREVFLFAARLFNLPPGISFPREVFPFAVTVMGHRTLRAVNELLFFLDSFLK